MRNSLPRLREARPKPFVISLYQACNQCQGARNVDNLKMNNNFQPLDYARGKKIGPLTSTPRPAGRQYLLMSQENIKFQKVGPIEIQKIGLSGSIRGHCLRNQGLRADVARQLIINILAMIYVKKDCRSCSFKIKKYPIASGNTKRKSRREGTHFLDVQPRIAPVFLKADFLDGVKTLDFFGQFLKCPAKVVGFDYLHEQ